MTLNTFIDTNRFELNACINKVLGEDPNKKQSKEEIRLWILNDEGLYRWARSEGVKI